MSKFGTKFIESEAILYATGSKDDLYEYIRELLKSGDLSIVELGGLKVAAQTLADTCYDIMLRG